jgi:hypothetical protein
MELLDLYFKSNNNVKTTVEVFNSYLSIANIKNPIYTNPNTQFNPYPIWTAPNGVPSARTADVSFTNGGNMIIARGNGSLLVEIEAIQYPYRAILDALKTRSIVIRKIRMSATTQQQLVENVTRIETEPLTNKYKEKIFNITISPNNVLPLLNDWSEPDGIKIDGRSGFRFELLPNEILGWNIHFDFL